MMNRTTTRTTTHGPATYLTPVFAALALGVACSGESDTTLLQPEALLEPAVLSQAEGPLQPEVVPEPGALSEPGVDGTSSMESFDFPTPEEREEEFQWKVRAPLSSIERVKIEAALEARGVDLNTAKLVGRMVLIDDLYLDAEDLLAAEVVDKGVTYGNSFGAAPDIYTRINGSGDFEMYHPYFGFSGTLMLITGSTALRDMITPAADLVENAADDCLTSSRIQAITTTDWNAMGIGQRGYRQTSVTWAALATACPGSSAGTRGCAVAPSIQHVFVNPSVSQNRMVPGFRIGLVNTAVTGTDDQSMSTMVHELLHVLGVAHQFPEPAAVHLRVPGTSGLGTEPSIMQGFCTPLNPPACTRSLTMSADDVSALDTLYSPLPGGTCEFQNTFEAACPVACAKVTSVDVRGDCCWCNGTLRNFVRSPWSTVTYLCSP